MELPKKIREKKLRLQTLHKNQISIFCGLEEERTKFRKKEKEKKEINLIAAKSGLLWLKGYLKTYNPMKYFLLY